MSLARSWPKTLLLRGGLPACLCLSGLLFFAGILPAQEAAPTASPSVQHLEHSGGTLVVGGQEYSVVLQEERLSTSSSPAANTLVGIEVRDGVGNVAYRESFPVSADGGHFLTTKSATAGPVTGKTGTGLLIHFLTRTPAPKEGEAEFSESWQFLSVVNGKLMLLGKPAGIGSPGAGPLMGVMMRAHNGAVSVINQPDEIEVRAWTGFFYAFLPLRVDWGKGAIGEGQRCMSMIGGVLRDVGCDMRVEADRKPLAGEYAFLRLFPEPYENLESVEHAVVQKASKLEILGGRAITSWNEADELVQPMFSDLWLHVRLDGREGWIHGDEDFAAAGLPAGSPAP